MKINIERTIIAACIGALIGLLCFVIAEEKTSYKWIFFAGTAISTFICLGLATACNYNCGYRDVNMKVTAWIFSILVILLNFIFSSFSHNVILYIVTISLITIINIAIINALYKPKAN